MVGRSCKSAVESQRRNGRLILCLLWCLGASQVDKAIRSRALNSAGGPNYKHMLCQSISTLSNNELAREIAIVADLT